MIVTDSSKIEALKRAFGKQYVIDSDGRNCTFKCPNPKCGSHAKSKLKLVIRVEDSACHCWVCDLRGKTATWIIRKWSPDALDRFLEVYQLGRDHNKVSIIPDKIEDEKYELPKDFRLLASMIDARDFSKGLIDPDAKSVLSYLMTRKITVGDMWRYKIGVSSETGYRRKVLFPSFNPDGEAEFCLARMIKSDALRTYKNYGAKTSKIIYDEIHVDFQQVVYLFEGVFDLIRSGMNGTVLMGSNLPISGKLFGKLAIERPPVVLCLDSDAKDKATHIASNLSKFGVDVKVSTIPQGKDPGSMDTDMLKKYLQNSRPFSWNDPLIQKIKRIKSGTIL